MHLENRWPNFGLCAIQLQNEGLPDKPCMMLLLLLLLLLSLHLLLLLHWVLLLCLLLLLLPRLAASAAFASRFCRLRWLLLLLR